MRHLRFLDAVDFIDNHPATDKSAIIGALVEGIWAQAEQAAQLQCLSEQLALARTLELDDRAGNLRCLLDLDRAQVESLTPLATRYCIVRSLINEIGILPESAQAHLYGIAAVRAIEILEAPYLTPLLASVFRLVQALAEDGRQDAWRTMLDELDAAVDNVIGDEFDTAFIPDRFDTLLDATEEFPDDLRLQALLDIKRNLNLSASDFREEAMQTLACKFNALPIPLPVRMTGSPLP